MASAGPSASSVLKECKAAVSDALECDCRGASVEAYIKYLSCCAKITVSLLQEATVMTSSFREHRGQLINLAQQCLERVSKLCPTINMREGTGLSAEEVAAVLQSGLVSATSIEMYKGHCVPPKDEQHQKQQLALSPAQNLLPPNHATPELAALQRNRLLLKQHQDKLAKMSKNTASATATLNLSLHRKLVENIAMARAQQTILDRQLLQKRQHMQELAEKSISLLRSQSENNEKKAEQKALLMSVLMYESEQPYVASWRSELRRRPADADFIHDLCTMVLRCEGHPLNEQLRKCQAQMLATLQNASGADADIFLDAVVTVPYDDPSEDSEQLDSVASSTIANCCPICGAAQCVGHNNDVEPERVGDNRGDTDSPSCMMGSSGSLTGHQSIPVESERAIDTGDADGTGCSSQNSLSRPVEQQSMSVHDWQPAVRLSHLDCAEFDDLFDDDNPNASVKNDTVQQGSPVPNWHPATGNAAVPCLPRTTGDKRITSERETEMLAPNTNSAVLSSNSLTAKSVRRKWLLEALAKCSALAQQLQTSIQYAQMALQELTGTFSIVYEELDMALAVVEASVQAAVEEEFFVPVHAPLLRLFRLVNISTEIKAACGMTKCQCSDMASFDVKEKWQLLVTESDSNTDARAPFANFSRALSRIPCECSPQQKLKCVVQAHKQLCSEIQNRCTSDNLAKTTVMGADDLLPIICYLTAKSRLPRLVSEYQFMEQFISSKCLMDEEGYCLLTLQAALEYVTSLGK